uniref:SCP domain-containing protein n=1 Tax=Neogobius melanostomus TaxID=47308 RepID=A0A8C6T5L1_9GOBI
MLPLKWDRNLKLVAEGYAAKCIWNHNPELEDTGENLFAGTGQLDLERAMEKWFLERMDYNYDNNSCDEDKMCGHYTQMVWADTHRVGCAVHLCAQMEGLAWTEPSNFLVCNYYPPGNYEGERPYVEGEWCSQCPEHFQRCENNLCAPEVKPTEAESIEETAEPDPAEDTVTLPAGTSSFQDLHIMDTTPGADQVPLPEQNPDQDLKETLEQEAAVPPPATESIPPEPMSTAVLGTDETKPYQRPYKSLSKTLYQRLNPRLNLGPDQNQTCSLNLRLLRKILQEVQQGRTGAKGKSVSACFTNCM